MPGEKLVDHDIDRVLGFRCVGVVIVDLLIEGIVRQLVYERVEFRVVVVDGQIGNRPLVVLQRKDGQPSVCVEAHHDRNSVQTRTPPCRDAAPPVLCHQDYGREPGDTGDRVPVRVVGRLGHHPDPAAVGGVHAYRDHVTGPIAVQGRHLALTAVGQFELEVAVVVAVVVDGADGAVLHDRPRQMASLGVIHPPHHCRRSQPAGGQAGCRQ